MANLLASNPFSTKYFEPGAIAYHFFGAETAQAMLERCQEQPGCYAIVGPHGSGKSTLLNSLARADKSSMQNFTMCLRNDGQSQSLFRSHLGAWPNSATVFVDGLEQLSWWDRWRLKRTIRRKGCTLIGTCHSDLPGFQVLWRTKIDEQTERWVLSQLLQDQPELALGSALASPAWQQSRKHHQQNLRESLFDMYDWWQSHDNRIR
jgi:energy-coupling factor transporter ATP-binding protein EcfA2